MGAFRGLGDVLFPRNVEPGRFLLALLLAGVAISVAAAAALYASIRTPLSPAGWAILLCFWWPAFVIDPSLSTPACLLVPLWLGCLAWIAARASTAAWWNAS